MASEKLSQQRAEIRRLLDLAWDEYDTIVLAVARGRSSPELLRAAREALKHLHLKWWLNED